jgi:hypothetical protein
MNAEASSRSAARNAGPISVQKTLAWKAKGQRGGDVDSVVEGLEAVDACDGAEDLQLRHTEKGSLEHRLFRQWLRQPNPGLARRLQHLDARGHLICAPPRCCCSLRQERRCPHADSGCRHRRKTQEFLAFHKAPMRCLPRSQARTNGSVQITRWCNLNANPIGPALHNSANTVAIQGDASAVEVFQQGNGMFSR